MPVNKLYFETINNNNKNKLILLHPHMYSGKIWKPLIPKLSKSFNLIIPDLPGHGKSPDLENNTIDNISELLIDFIEKNKFQNSYIIGLSLGGTLALNLSASSNYFKKCIIINSAYHHNNISLQRIRFLNRIDKYFQNIENVKKLEKYIKYEFTPNFIDNMLGVIDKSHNKIKENVYDDLIKELMSSNSLRALYEIAKDYQKLDYTYKISKISIPTLSINSTLDKTISPHVGKELNNLNKNILYEIIDKEPHLVVATAPDKVYKILDNFLYE